MPEQGRHATWTFEVEEKEILDGQAKPLYYVSDAWVSCSFARMTYAYTPTAWMRYRGSPNLSLSSCNDQS